MIFIIFMMMNIVLLTIIMTIIGSSEEVSRDAACYPVNTELTILLLLLYLTLQCTGYFSLNL